MLFPLHHLLTNTVYNTILKLFLEKAEISNFAEHMKLMFTNTTCPHYLIHQQGDNKSAPALDETEIPP